MPENVSVVSFSNLDTPLKVLLVEDEPGDSLLVEVALNTLNPKPEIRRRASLAEVRADADSGLSFDIALVDLSLPDSFGIKTVEAVSQAFDDTPIIVLTGLDDAILEEQIVSSGAQDYLVKGSFRSDALTRAIRHALSRHRLERRLALSEAKNRALVEMAPDGILVTGEDGVITSANPAAERMFDQSSLVDRNIIDLLPDAPSLLATLKLSTAHRLDGQALRHDIPFPVSMAAAKLDSGEIMLLISDLTERVQLTEQLQAMVRTDPLTGLVNRRAFTEQVEVEFQRYRRTGLMSVLVMIDIDHFKQVNDHYGHQAGDRALIQLAELLKDTLRITDQAVRFGGEEFILLMSGAEIEGGVDVAERVRQRAAQIVVPSANGNFGFTISAGVAAFASSDHDWQDTLRRADEALYRAKAMGRNRVVLQDQPKTAVTTESL